MCRRRAEPRRSLRRDIRGRESAPLTFSVLLMSARCTHGWEPTRGANRALARVAGWGDSVAAGQLGQLPDLLVLLEPGGIQPEGSPDTARSRRDGPFER
jgi:hypothetical protein